MDRILERSLQENLSFDTKSFLKDLNESAIQVDDQTDLQTNIHDNSLDMSLDSKVQSTHIEQKQSMAQNKLSNILNKAKNPEKSPFLNALKDVQSKRQSKSVIPKFIPSPDSSLITKLKAVDQTIKNQKFSIFDVKRDRQQSQNMSLLNPKINYSILDISSKFDKSNISYSTSKHAKLKPLQSLDHYDHNDPTEDSIIMNNNYKLKIRSDLQRLISFIDEKKLQVQDTQWQQICKTGDRGKQAFNYHYKNLNKIMDSNKNDLNEPSELSKILSKQNESKLFPSKLGLIKESNQNDLLNLSNYQFGDNHVEALSHMIQKNKAFKRYILKNNRITSIGAHKLIQNLNPQLITLDLSKNRIGGQGAQDLHDYLCKPYCKLRELSIESNKLGDEHINNILQGVLANNGTITNLNISDNNVTDENCDIISDIILRKRNLIELYLHWNKMTHKGGEQIFFALQDNTNLKVLDFSWNNLGNSITYLCEFLKTNTNVLHLDISNNKFTFQDCVLISEQIFRNKSIIGFHFQGNFGFVDNKGFLTVDKPVKSNQIPFLRKIQGIKPQQLKAVTTLDPEFSNQNVCWICDNWYDTTFKLITTGIIQTQPEKSLIAQKKSSGLPKSSFKHNTSKITNMENKKQNYFIHFSFEEYVPRFIGQSNVSNTYIAQAVVPNRFFNFFFTVDYEVILSDQDKIQDYQENIIEITVPFKNKTMTYNLSKLNVHDFNIHANIIDREYRIQMRLLPRTKVLNSQFNEEEEVDIWDRANSIFKQYRFESPDTYSRCLDFDFQYLKIQRMCKTLQELNEVKDLLKQNYPLIKDAYKYYSSASPVDGIFCIHEKQLIQIIKDIDIQQSDQDIQNKLIAINTNQIIKQNNSKIPTNSIVRHQFFEFIFRFIDQKMFRSSANNSTPKLLESLIKHLQKYWLKFEQNKWRDEIYSTEPIEIIFRYFQRALKDVFDKFSIRKVQNGQKQFMCLDELIVIFLNQELCHKLQLFDKEEQFKEVDANRAFNLSHVLEIDEISNNKIQQLSYIEFLEALSRIADIISLPRFDYKGPQLSYEERVQAPLMYKVEAICIQIVYISSSELRMTFKLPETSLVSQFEKVDLSDKSSNVSQEFE